MRGVKDECVGRSTEETDSEQEVDGSEEHGGSKVRDGKSSKYWVGYGNFR